MRKLVLASQSPRRKELLEKLAHPFEVCPAVGEEVMDGSLSPDDLVESLAQQKAREVFALHSDHVVIGADTVVALEGEVFGKPKDEGEAIQMISRLQGKTHHVFTGVCICAQGKERVFHEKTAVRMKTLSPSEVKAYVSQGESMDKAGAYGLQSLGAWLVESIEGDMFNVIGLPLCALGKVLPDFGIELFGNEESG